jgi:hypothetical protein
VLFGFQSPLLRRLCERQDEAEGLLGEAFAKGLRTCLADLEAADSLLEASSIWSVLGCGDKLKIDVYEGNEIVFCQNHADAPMKDGQLDFSKVFRIRVISIGDYE